MYHTSVVPTPSRRPKLPLTTYSVPGASLKTSPTQNAFGVSLSPKDQNDETRGRKTLRPPAWLGRHGDFGVHFTSTADREGSSVCSEGGFAFQKRCYFFFVFVSGHSHRENNGLFAAYFYALGKITYLSLASLCMLIFCVNFLWVTGNIWLMH